MPEGEMTLPEARGWLPWRRSWLRRRGRTWGLMVPLHLAAFLIWKTIGMLVSNS